MAAAEPLGHAGLGRQCGACDEGALGPGEPAKGLDGRTRHAESRTLLRVDAVHVDRVERADAPVVEEERGRRVLREIERALRVREEHARELGVRRRGGDRGDRGIRGFGPSLEDAVLRAHRSRQRSRGEVQDAPGEGADDVLERRRRPQDVDLDDDRHPHRREVEQVRAPQGDGAEADRPEEDRGNERVVPGEQRDGEREREELRDRADRRGDVASRSPRRERLDAGGDRQGDAHREGAGGEVGRGGVGLVRHSDEDQDRDRQRDAGA